MSKQSMENIRKAICKNRGGWSDATDQQIMIIWRELPPDTQKQYLESIGAQPKTKQKESVKDAVSTKPEPDVSGSSG